MICKHIFYKIFKKPVLFFGPGLSGFKNYFVTVTI